MASTHGQTCGLLRLPNELLLWIYESLDCYTDVYELSHTCRRLRDVYINTGRRGLLEKVVRNNQEFRYPFPPKDLHRVSPSVYAFHSQFIKVDYDSLPPELRSKGTIRDTLYGKHHLPADEFGKSLHEFLDQFEGVRNKWADMAYSYISKSKFRWEFIEVVELSARYQKALHNALKEKPHSLFESTTLVALALRCLVLAIDLGRFFDHSGDLPNKTSRHVLVHEGGIVRPRPDRETEGVLPKIEFSDDRQDFLSQPYQEPDADGKDDLLSMLTFVVQMMLMQMVENRAHSWLANILTLCIMSRLPKIFEGGRWRRRPPAMWLMWPTLGDTLAKLFKELCRHHERLIETSPLSHDWNEDQYDYESEVEYGISTKYALELYHLWLEYGEGKPPMTPRVYYSIRLSTTNRSIVLRRISVRGFGGSQISNRAPKTAGTN
ncbi:uncharacterized protein DSM5745_07744 [Aspergillus mulundensis]|uniref:F-box domain-containing protein n=1 Tax=Aspergillus mulundensis TaxID=1810919 RepID=A0A3D8REW9_9EURO|nr:hypothetical protein DSM5745_07744 [Aspergillus mulundensis]RDW72572.1 hypothetical protein DSM5745_07744 [Aspergillus mulundensis]